MTLMLDLPPQKEKELQEAIAVNDADQMREVLTSALDDLIFSLLQNPSEPLTGAEWDRVADELVAYVDSILPDDVPVLSDYAISREGIYGDHP